MPMTPDGHACAMTAMALMTAMRADDRATCVAMISEMGVDELVNVAWSLLAATKHLMDAIADVVGIAAGP